MTHPSAAIPRAPYAAAMCAAGVAGLALGMLAASAAGGSATVVTAVGVALAAGWALCAVPLLGPGIIKPQVWGLSVLAVSMMRTLLALGAMLIFIEVQGLERRPVVFGLLAGTGVIMAAEAVVAAWLLTRQDRRRRANASMQSQPPAAPEGARR